MASDTTTDRPSVTISNALAGFRDPSVPVQRPVGAQSKRAHTGGAPDAVMFLAACPACGRDCVWSEEREDTRLHAAVTCPCGG